ncbi:MAG: hypothetical protein JRF72_22835 [Deltaproteobacteria bacterium]|nr:hypothetical protein [Deltaproteobacteria bacterium]
MDHRFHLEAISNPPQADWFKIKAEKHRGGAEFQPAGILQYFEELKRGPNAEVEPKDIFEIASNKIRIVLEVFLDSE